MGDARARVRRHERHAHTRTHANRPPDVKEVNQTSKQANWAPPVLLFPGD